MAERRHAGRRQQRQRFLGGGRQRHGERLLRAGKLQQRLDRQLGIELRRRADHEDHRVVVVVRQQPLDRTRHDLGLGAGQGEIDQLALTRRDAERLQPVDQRLRRIGNVEAGDRHVVDDHRRAAAGRGGHRDALAGRRRPIDQQRRYVDQRFEHRHAGDAVALAESVERRVGAGDRAGVRLGELLADVGAAELVGHHRLAGGMRPPRRPRQPLAVAQGFHEQQDRLGLGIVDQQVGDLADLEIDLVADRDQPREADAARVGARQQRTDQTAALAHQPPVALASLSTAKAALAVSAIADRCSPCRCCWVRPAGCRSASRSAPARPAATRPQRPHRRSRRPGSRPP